MSEDKNNFINEAGKNGLILAAVAIIYFLASAFLGKGDNGGFLKGLLGFVLWGAKFALCIWLMVRFLRNFAAENDKDRSKTFRFGTAVALCSSIVYAGFYLLYITVIDPGFFKETFDSIAGLYSSMLTSEEMDKLMNMESSMPTASFFVNLIWCWLIGTVISAISSNRICGPDNPFEE